VDQKELLAKVLSFDEPELQSEPGMVAQVWEDGELTLQKSGELLWCRSLHMIEPGRSGVRLEGMRSLYNGYGFVTVRELEKARELAKLIRENAEVVK